jgi:heat shock protein HslJ
LNPETLKPSNDPEVAVFKRLPLFLMALAALLLLAACGRDEEPTPPPVATADAPAAAPATEAAAPATEAPAATATEAAEQPESPLAPAQAESPLPPAETAAVIDTAAVTGTAGAAAQAESPLPEPNALTGSAWQLTAIGGSDPVSGTLVTLQFDADGSVAGSDGCNRYVASYTIDEGAGTIAFVPGPGTMMACDQAVMDQGAAYTAALAGVAAFTLEGDTLTLSDAGGDPVLVFGPQQSDLAGSHWEATSYNNGEEGVVTVGGEPAITLSFGAEGEISGFGGCNTFTGTFDSPAIGQVTIGEIAATRKACAQPEGVMEQEQRYLAALPTAATYTVQGDFLDLRTADGQIAAQFFRATE